MNTEHLDKPLIDYLPDVAESLAAQLVELHKRPSANAAERVAYNLAGAHHMTLQVRADLLGGSPA